MVECHSMRRSRSAVVTGQKEPVMAQRRHDLDLILRHDAEGVVHVVGSSVGWTDAVAVASKVGRDHVKAFGQGTGYLVPRGMGERVAVQQQEWRPITTVPEKDVGAARANPSRFEAAEKTGIGWKRTW
jgi:hypothetical protein